MAGIKLYPYQIDAVRRMKNGCILCGGVGSGKSRTGLAYYYLLNGGKIDTDNYIPMDEHPKDLYIITTARKRDTLEWEKDMGPFLLSTKPENCRYKNKIVVDSWNNITKYVDISNAFFIFDEQRLVGTGKWSKSFLKIAKNNQWILLTATPGDQWSDYISVFVANGFYKNPSEFRRRHIVYSRYVKFPKIEKYLETGRLIRLRNRILVQMDFKRETISHHEDIYVDYDATNYRMISRSRWNPWDNKPIENASEYCYALRRVVNTDDMRLEAVADLMKEHPRAIIFYNFDYELELLRGLAEHFGIEYAEWNGHKHQDIPIQYNKWMYLVQYTAGAEGWNCTLTDTIIFYSQNYSYKTMVQASGRIDRLNTPFRDLYYYHLKSRSGIDLAISKALSNKKKFNETKFAGKYAKNA